MGSLKALSAAPVFCLLAACGSASGTSNNTTANAPVTANAVSQTTVSTDPTAFKLGAVLSGFQYYSGSRPFMNLIYGSGWQMASTSGAVSLPPEYLDANGWVKSLPTGYRVMRVLSIPLNGGNFICRFQGNGQLGVGGSTVSNVVMGAGQTTFTIATSYPNPAYSYLSYQVDPTNYIRNIDCREAAASTTAAFSPEYLSTLNGFKVARFVKWMPSVESNSGIKTAFPQPTITWATRNKPGDGDYTGNDGVPVEVMVDLANQAGASPWFNIPWNADDDYITRFATYVRDNLAPGSQVYVETSNEVWNWVYPVTTQAAAEGAAEGLPGNQFSQVTERYSEKTQHVMQIWSNVFAGQMNRLVRVYAFQNAQPYYGDLGLKYNNTYQYVDAFATAPYWAFSQNEYTGQSLDDIMNTILPGKITETLGLAAQNKAIAQKYGLRYVTYEAGQHVVLPNNLDLMKQIERDPRMYDLYKSYISQWQSQFGDLMTQFALNATISQYGGWGLVEYIGQPISQSTTPKMQAVKEFLGTTVASDTTTSTTTPGTQVCPDGSVISATSTCPTAPTTSTQVCSDGSVIPLTSTCPAPTTTTTTPTSGKKNGATKGGGSGKGRTATA
jgi:hypothetical protein